MEEEFSLPGGDGVRAGLWKGLREGLGVPLQSTKNMIQRVNQYTSYLKGPSSSPTEDRLNPSLGVAELDIRFVETAETRCGPESLETPIRGNLCDWFTDFNKQSFSSLGWPSYLAYYRVIDRG